MPRSVTHQGHTTGARLPSKTADGAATERQLWQRLDCLAWSWAVADFTNS
jgi:hypothetical protein